MSLFSWVSENVLNPLLEAVGSLAEILLPDRVIFEVAEILGLDELTAEYEKQIETRPHCHGQ